MTISTTSQRATPRRPGAPNRRGGRRLAVAGFVLVVGGVVALLATGATAIGGVFRSTAFGGPLPSCRVADVPAPHATLADWDRTLLDTSYTLDRSYAPPDLVSTEEAGLSGGGSVRAFVILDLEALARAARTDGREISVESAYRDFGAQTRTFDSLVRAYGEDFALRSAARPGHSEHQLGTTLDFVGGESWLAANAWRFGFVLSYPPDRSPTYSCYKAEPWHYRYFGRDRAAAIHAAGISPREWLWLHADEAG